MAIYSRPGAARLARTAQGRDRARQVPAPRKPTPEALADADPPAWVFLTGMMSPQSSTAMRAKAQA